MPIYSRWDAIMTPALFINQTRIPQDDILRSQEAKQREVRNLNNQSMLSLRYLRNAF
jgi:hypothetical protein